MEITKKERVEVTDKVGEKIVEFRDRELSVMMEWVSGSTINPVMKKKYGELASLSKSQQELIYDLLSEAISGAIYDMLEMIEENHEWIKLLIKHNNTEYDLCRVSEKMGSEIVDGSEEGWIQKFSKVGRFVL